MSRTLTTIKVLLLVDNTVINTQTLKLAPLYNGQFGADWQGHRVEAKVDYVGVDTTHGPVLPPCTQAAVPLALSVIDGSTPKTDCA